MRIPDRRRFASILMLVGALTLTSCTNTEPTPASPDVTVTDGDNTNALEQLIADGLANAQSDLQREILQKAQQSGQISENDWKEANNQHKACMTAKGYDVEIIYSGADVLLQSVAEIAGGKDEENAAHETRKQADFDCYQKTSAFINEIYSYLNGGQSSLDGDTIQRAVLACLIDRGLAPADTSYDEFLADLEQNEGKQFSHEGQEKEAEVTACWIENT